MKISHQTRVEATMWVLIALLLALTIAAVYLFREKVGL